MYVCFIVERDLVLSSSSSESSMSDEVFVEEESAQTAALNVAINLLQQISALMQQVVDTLRALRQ